jgi:hypothetical protein
VGEKPLNHLNQFGGSLGGPLKANRTFFFADYDQGRINKGNPFIVTVPTVKMHNGDFSELSAPIYDPLRTARTAFPGNIIPGDRLDPMAVKLMSLYPMPNLPGLANNFAYTGLGWQTNQTADVRIDHRLTAKDTIFARYSYNLTNGLTPSQCPVTQIGDRSVDPTCNINGTAGIYSGPYHTFVSGNYDPQTNLLYWGVGNGGPWMGDLRPGDNLYISRRSPSTRRRGRLSVTSNTTPTSRSTGMRSLLRCSSTTGGMAGRSPAS